MLSQASGYAISALGFIANQGGRPAPIKAAAKACRTPAAYLAKIVNHLARANLVQTQRGAGGGVLLARPAEEITLHEVCTILGDDVLKPRCMLGNAECSNNRACPAHRLCRVSRSRVSQFLHRTTIDDIAQFEARVGVGR